MYESLFSMAISLFLLMDSIGNVPIYLSVLKEMTPKHRTWIIFRELVIALVVIVGFYFVGNYFLNLLKVEQYTVMISGGIILFIIALKMIFPTPSDVKAEAAKDRDPLVVPLAIPLVAGPAVLATVMLYSHQSVPKGVVIGAIGIAWTATTLILIGSSFIKKFLGIRGIVALERLMGLLLTLIGIQMFLEGLHIYTTIQ